MAEDNQDALHVGIFQMDLSWEMPVENINKIEHELKNYGSNLDVLILPEMFTTGFSMQASHLAMTYSDSNFERMVNLAKTYQCSIIGSVWFNDEGKYYNRCFHWGKLGEVEYYDKVHVFTLVNEDDVITRGEGQKTFHVRNWKIRPQICYDLRFPKGSYNQESEPYDLLLYVANWPNKRIGAWDILLQARAVENQSYVIGVNRVGEEPGNIKYSGHSTIVNYTGERLVELPEYKEGISTVILEKKPQMKFRNRFPFIKDEI